MIYLLGLGTLGKGACDDPVIPRRSASAVSSGVINWPTYHSTHYPNSDCDNMATQNDNKSPKELILAANDHVEGQLLKELQCLSRGDLECYVKSRDEERAFHMMTKHLQSHGIHQFKDDDIRYQCTFIGNTLHHRSRDLAAEAHELISGKRAWDPFRRLPPRPRAKTVTPKTPQFRHQSPRQPHQMMTPRSENHQWGRHPGNPRL